MSQEVLKRSHEVNHESKENLKNNQEHRERLREQLETAAEKSQEKNLETARSEAFEQANSAERVSEKVETSERPVERGPVAKQQKEASFKATMTEIQGQMSAPSKAFSKVIHNKAVEKASEATGASIARPNALLSGAICAFFLTLAVYLIAKNIGYPLSGFESIGAFILGWSLGTAYDFIKVMVTGKR